MSGGTTTPTRAPRRTALADGTCPACGGDRLHPVVTLPELPVLNNDLWPDAASALAAPRGTIDLVICEACGLLGNAAFDPAAVVYASGYENSLHGSAAFQAFAEGLAARLAAAHVPPGGRVLEVGAGSGEFLALLCATAGCHGHGFDPSHTPDDPRLGDTAVTVASDVVAAEPVGHVDLVVCRHVLEHVAAPADFLATLAVDPGAAVYLEVPDAGHMLRHDAVWDLLYEHPWYFAEPALRALLGRCGFTVLAAGTGFHGQFAWIEARPTGTVRVPDPPDQAVAGLLTLAARFAGRLQDRLASQQQRLGGAAAEGRLAVWGAGTKGVTFCNLVPAAARARLVIDVNPRKHGRHLPGTGQLVAPPEALVGSGVDTVVVMNPAYEDEVRTALSRLGVSATVVPG